MILSAVSAQSASAQSAPLGGLAELPFARTLQARRVVHLAAWSVAGSTIGVGGTYTYGPLINLEHFDEALVFFTVSGSPTGSPAGLTIVMQALEPVSGQYITLPSCSWTPSIPSGTFTGILAVQQVSAFGDLVRFGATMTTAWTAGTLNVQVRGKQ